MSENERYGKYVGRRWRGRLFPSDADMTMFELRLRREMHIRDGGVRGPVPFVEDRIYGVAVSGDVRAEVNPLTLPFTTILAAWDADPDAVPEI